MIFLLPKYVKIWMLFWKQLEFKIYYFPGIYFAGEEKYPFL